MRKLFKFCLWSLGGLIIVAIIAMIALVTMINPNRYKDQISRQIYKTTGHQANIGNISWSILPWIKLRINDVTVANPTGFPTSPFITVKQAAVSINLLDLLNRKLIVNKITINGMQVNLIRTLNNSNNWTMPSTSKTLPATPSYATTGSHQGIIKSFNINAIAIFNSSISWNDETKNQHIAIKINTLNTKNINLNGIPFTVNSTISYQMAQLTQPINIKLTTDINANQKNQQYHFDNLTLSLNQFKTTGSIQVNQKPTPVIKANLSIPTTNIAALFNALGHSLNLQNKSALNSVGGNLTLIINHHNVQINDLTLSIDGSKINGQINLTQLKPLHGNFAFAIDKLNLDQYQTVATPKKNTISPLNTADNASTTVPAPTANASILPTYLQSAAISGKLTVGALQVDNMQLQQVDMPITMKNSEITASPITAQFYQGTLQADATANYSTTVPAYSLSATLNNINVQSLLQQAANFNKLTGTGQITLLLNTSGEEKNSVLTNLNGNGQIQLSNGNYTGLDIMNALNSAANLFFKKEVVNTTEPSQTNFTGLKATFQIHNGLIANNDLAVSSPVMTISGNGTVSLVTDSIDYYLSVTPTSEVISQVAKLQKIIGGSIPLRVTGTINSPTVAPDLNKISIAVNKQTLDKNMQDLNQGINKFGKALKKSLNDVFGN